MLEKRVTSNSLKHSNRRGTYKLCPSLSSNTPISNTQIWNNIIRTSSSEPTTHQERTTKLRVQYMLKKKILQTSIGCAQFVPELFTRQCSFPPGSRALSVAVRDTNWAGTDKSARKAKHSPEYAAVTRSARGEQSFLEQI